MLTFDPLAAYESGQPAAAQAARAFERGQSQADKARQILKRNMAVEAMKIRAQELYSHMEQTPENQNLAQRQAFLEYAPGVYGEEGGLAEGIGKLLSSEEANLVRASANKALQERSEENRDLRRQIAEANLNKPTTAYREAMEQASLEAGVSPERIDLLQNATKSRPSVSTDESQKEVTPSVGNIQKRALQIMQSNQNKDSSQESERKAYSKLIEDKSVIDALVKGNPEDQKLRKIQRQTNAELEMMRSQHKPPMTGRLEINPDGTISMGFGEGMATVGTQTATQGELANIKNSIVQIDQAMNVLTEKDLGVAGNVWDRLVNRYLVQLVPEAADPKVSSNRAQLQKAVDSYLQSQQRSGLRLSAPERADVRDTLVSQSLGESLPRAQSVLHTMGKMQKFEAIARAKTGSQPLQAWMFNGLSQEEIKQLGKDKIITDQEMFDWASKAPMLRWVPPAQTTTPPAATPPPYRSPSSQAPPGTVG